MRFVLALLLVLIASPAWAAISCSAVSSGTSFSTTNATSYATSSVTLPANNLILLKVWSLVAAGTVNVPTATSTGATWVLIDHQQGAAVTTRGVTVLRTMVASDQAGAVTIDFAGQTQSHALWSIEACSGVDTSGTNGSGAVAQSNKEGVESTDTYTFTFTAFLSSANRPNIAIGFSATTVGTTEGAPWSELANQTVGAEGSCLAGSYATDTTDTAFTYTRSGAIRYGTIGVEIKALGGGGILGGGCCGGLIN